MPITYWPACDPTLANFVTAFTTSRSCASCVNCLSWRRCSTILCVLVSALAAYALVGCACRFRGAIIACPAGRRDVPADRADGAAVPDHARLWACSTPGLALILPYAVFSLPVCTLVLMSFFQDIPPDLEERRHDRRLLPRRRAGAQS